MDIETISREFVHALEARITQRTAKYLQHLRTGEPLSPSNPFTGKPLYAHTQPLHELLKPTGLLENEDFRKALARFLHSESQSSMMEVLSLHDGAFRLDMDREYQIRVQGGPPLVNYLHELMSHPAPPEW